MTNDQPEAKQPIRHSDFVIDSSFWFGHWSFPPLDIANNAGQGAAVRYDDRRLTFDRRGGFTLIEVMVAVGIILLLIGILIVGISFVGRSAKEKATRVTLKNVQSMFAELDAKTRLRNQPRQWSWRGVDIVPTTAHAALNLNFFTAPFRNDEDQDGF